MRGEAGRLDAPEDVPQLLLLGPEVAPARLRGRDLDRETLHDLEPVALEAHELARVVREEPHPLHPALHEYLRADAVVALVRLEAEGLVRLHGVAALVLELVGHDLVHEPDAAPL